MASTSPQIVQWILDTRPLWPVSKLSSQKQEVAMLRTIAARSLQLLTTSEQTAVIKYFKLSDAKMCLASHLLKHFVICKYANVPWSEATVSRDSNGKPCYIGPSSTQRLLDFNVSHQAGIVSLIAVIGPEGGAKIEVGTDVVCWNERLTHDYAHIDRDGFPSFVDTFADIFAPSEVRYMKTAPVEIDAVPLSSLADTESINHIGHCQRRHLELKVTLTGEHGSKVTVSSNEIIEKKLKRFYACWCLRETYVKMTGEALLAPWLKDLEIMNVVPPSVSSTENSGSRERYNKTSLGPGDVKRDFQVKLRGSQVKDFVMELAALCDDYMVGGAIRPASELEKLGLRMHEWRKLDLIEDIVNYAESHH